MKLLFVMLHPGFVRYYESALHALAADGHQIHVAFEITRDKLGEDVTARRLAEASPRITCGTTPERTESVRAFLARADRSATRSGELFGGDAARSSESAWESLATTVRLLLDYVRYFDPVFADAHKLRDRAEKRLPRVPAAMARATVRIGAQRVFARMLGALERAIPSNAALEAFIREQNPDLLLVTPLIELGSQQVDYVKCARRLGVRSALCVASWDNLTSKGLIRINPDHVVVWNEAQKAEAVTLHGVAPDRVVVTGAQLFDHWFAGKPGRSREAFCRTIGLDPERPFITYVGSSIFIAPEEVPFVERWIREIRSHADPRIAQAGILLRPHPANSRQWRTLDTCEYQNVVIWPPIGSGPADPQFRGDYFDSLHHCAAVVGINTSAQLEAGILRRPVFTIHSPEFAHAQEGTLHFRHLVQPGTALVQEARSLDQHVDQLAPVLRGDAPPLDHAAFLESFIRPHGLEQPATPIFARAVGELAALPRPHPAHDGIGTVLLRPVARVCASAARALSEDRPLWVYAARPFITTGVWSTAVMIQAVESARESSRLAIKRACRGTRHAWHESTLAIGRRAHRARKALRTTGAAARRAFIR